MEVGEFRVLINIFCRTENSCSNQGKAYWLYGDSASLVSMVTKYLTEFRYARTTASDANRSGHSFEGATA